MKERLTLYTETMVMVLVSLPCPTPSPVVLSAVVLHL